MQGFDFSKVPKLMADSSSINYTPNHFLVAFSSGNAASAFVVPPGLMKVMMRTWSDKVVEYEAKYGAIDTTGAQAGIQSPVQM